MKGAQQPIESCPLEVSVAWVLIHLSWLYLDIARPKAARRFLRDALTRCERREDGHAIARCQNLRGYLAWASVARCLGRN